MAQIWGRGWGGTFIVWEIPFVATVPQLGLPFLDRQCLMQTSLGASTPILTSIGAFNPLASAIEKECRFRSSRLDKSVS